MNEDLVKAQTRERMRRYRDRLREKGLKEIVLWVTSREERAVRKFLKELRSALISPGEHRVKARTARRKRRVP